MQSQYEKFFDDQRVDLDAMLRQIKELNGDDNLGLMLTRCSKNKEVLIMKQFKRFSLAIFVLAFIAICEDDGSILTTNTSADPSAADPSYCDSVNKGNNKFQQFLCGSDVVRLMTQQLMVRNGKTGVHKIV